MFLCLLIYHLYKKSKLMKIFPFLFLLLSLTIISCTPTADDTVDPNTTDRKIRFQFKFDENQTRLGAIGQASVIPEGNAAQTPDFQKLSVHVMDMTPNRFTPYGQGFLAYKGAETTAGGANAVDFDKAIIKEENTVFLELPLNEMEPGTYEYARVSVSFQQYDIKFNINNVPQVGNLEDQTATVASFLGFNNYIGDVQVRDETLSVNDDKLQGFWAFETDLTAPWSDFNQLYSGESPSGATTVVNPLAGDSDIPAGSCVVTGAFTEPLIITGEEVDDILVTLSFSINESFEWKDLNGNGKLDFYADEGSENEQIVDMGLRGLVASWEEN